MMIGVCLITSPQLSLSADQLAKLDDFDPSFGSISSYNIDQYKDSAIQLQKIYDDILSLHKDTTRTCYLIVSPQALHSLEYFQIILLQLHSRSILKFIVLDEIRLLIQHGSSFWESILLLKPFFQKVLLRITQKSILFYLQ
uniref:Uncharacterized protein n=2 Tax=Corethron hystrix TaxID=216773 RepID=A0A7S1FQE4_9STRA|mmetsp:Transcript_20442/g.46410  ORF Transcript_20442/g.46410 Transcript_20442/m.46410 type:complete len:141 (+) Transcript_20442:83-505(+)